MGSSIGSNVIIMSSIDITEEFCSQPLVYKNAFSWIFFNLLDYH